MRDHFPLDITDWFVRGGHSRQILLYSLVCSVVLKAHCWIATTILNMCTVNFLLRCRASILTGRYPHNTGTFENTAPRGCNSQSWHDRNENRTIGPLLSANGYKTGFFGKYMNQYALKSSGMGPEHVPPGWDKWYALVGNSKYYHYTVSNDGKAEPHGDSYAEDYFTDRIKNESVDFIMNMKGKQSPFFMYISTPAPHGPFTPAPQYNHTYDGVQAPRTPSYGYPGTDKHWIISKGDDDNIVTNTYYL